MITEGAHEVAETLLNGFLNDTCPKWTKMPRLVKHQLMKNLGEKNYNNIHDPRLYEDLDRIWNGIKEAKEKDIVDREKLAAKVECAVCLETYDGNDKVTTLMCGHKFCSKCIFQHIQRLEGNTCCPLCRRNVFHLDTPLSVTVASNNISDGDDAHDTLDRLRNKRRIQRMNKRKRKREEESK